MRNILYKNKGQATTELAVMGMMILIVFGMLLRYCQMFDMQQWTQMHAFRKAIEETHKRMQPYPGHPDGDYGAVTVVAMPEIYGVNTEGIDRTPSFVSASGSANFHHKRHQYHDGWEGNPKRDVPGWVPITYYQMGNKMINENKAVVMPLMLVSRVTEDLNVDPYSGVHSLVADYMNYLDPNLEPGRGKQAKTYQILEAAPVEIVRQNITVSADSRYAASETPAHSAIEEAATVNHSQNFHYKMQSPAKIYRESSDGRGRRTLVNIERMPEDVIINLDKHIESSREVETPR